MGAMYAFQVELHYLECGACQIPHAITKTKYREAQEGKSWYCPNGHCIGFTETENAKLKKQIETLTRQKEWANQTAEENRKRAARAERRTSAVRGVVTKIKKRVGNGVCPCCNRTFQNLMEHMKIQHPTFKQVRKK